MCTLDLDSFRSEPNSQLVKPTRLARHRNQSDWFLKGPIPGAWLSAASRLPGKAFHVGVALWHAAGMVKQTEVKMTQQLLGKFCVLRKAGARGLQQLESAGLVSVVRHVGRCPLVKINEVLP